MQQNRTIAKKKRVKSKMVSLVSPSSSSIVKSRILFSLPNDQKNSPSNSPPRGSNTNRKPPQRRRINLATPPLPIQSSQQKQNKQPSVAEIERAIGAGIFRDRDTDSESEENKTLFDTIFLNTIGKTEGSVEKKLRETGEWVLDRTEGAARSSGDKVLKAMFTWVLPIWVLSFFVASGFIKLPFNIPLLDDLIM